MTPDDLVEPVDGRGSLGHNRAAPEELLIRLLDINPGFLWRQNLPAVALDAAVAHPDRDVRSRVVEARHELPVPRPPGVGPARPAERWPGPEGVRA